MSRVYVSEYKRFFTSVSFDLARVQGQFDNAMSWYTSNPIDENLERLKEAHVKRTALVEKLIAHHPNLNPGLSSAHDPDPGYDG